MVTFASLNELPPPYGLHPFEPPPPPAVRRRFFFLCDTNRTIDTFDWTLEHVETFKRTNERRACFLFLKVATAVGRRNLKENE